MFDGGTSLSDGYSALIAQVGTRTQSANYAAKLSSTIADNLEADRTAVSGVNLDEEAAKLLQFQQAYQASAKMLQVAQGILTAWFRPWAADPQQGANHDQYRPRWHGQHV